MNRWSSERELVPAASGWGNALSVPARKSAFLLLYDQLIAVFEVGIRHRYDASWIETEAWAATRDEVTGASARFGGS